MKYEDYYSVLGVEHDASESEIKKAYRGLARKFHPDVTSDPAGEEKFKKIAEAYQTLKDRDKRAAYDQLGRYQAGQEFQPPPDWERQFSGAGAGFSFNDLDFSDLFSSITGRGRFGARNAPGTRSRTQAGVQTGRDYEVTANISLEDACHGTTLELNLSLPVPDTHGRLRSTPRTFNVRIPKGTVDGQKLRLTGQGGPGINGGRNGDLYINIAFRAHPLFKVKDLDLYIDLPLTPWEAALGASIDLPTLGNHVKLKVPAGTSAAKKLKITHRGLPGPGGSTGDLYAVVSIVVPTVISERERTLFKELAAGSTFNPRSHFKQEFA